MHLGELAEIGEHARSSQHCLASELDQFRLTPCHNAVALRKTRVTAHHHKVLSGDGHNGSSIVHVGIEPSPCVFGICMKEEDTLGPRIEVLMLGWGEVGVKAVGLVETDLHFKIILNIWLNLYCDFRNNKSNETTTPFIAAPRGHGGGEGQCGDQGHLLRGA